MQRKVYLDFQDSQGFRDVSSLVKYDTLNVTLRAFSENFHYAQNEATFDMLYDSTIYALLRAATKDIIIKIIDVYDVTTFLALESSGRLLTEDGFYLLTETGGFEPFFYGRITPNKSRVYDGILANTIITLQAEDDTKLLDVPIGDIVYSNYTIMNPVSPSTSIVHQLAYLVGLSAAQVGNVTISTSFTKFAPNDPSDSILEVLNALLFEHGYAVNFDVNGVLTPIRWINTDAVSFNFTESNMVKQVQVNETARTFYGAEVIYYEIGTLISGLLYRDTNCPYADTGGGYTGYSIPAGNSYPPTTNVTDPATGVDTLVYQEYTDDAVKYWTNAAIVQKLDYNYKAFSSDFSGILATANHVLDNSFDTGITYTATFFNKKALVKYENPTGGFLNLYFNNIRGDIWYRTTERSSKIINTTISGSNIDQYSSSFLFNKTDADYLVKHLAAIYNVGNLTYTIVYDPTSTNEKNIAIGQVVNITMGDGTNQNCIISESNWDETTQQYQYKLRAYASNIGSISITSQVVKDAPVSVGTYTASVDSIPAVVAAYNSRYYGKYLDSAPTGSFVEGDVYTRYSASSGVTNRGVFVWTNGAWVRNATDAKYIKQAMADIAFIIAHKTNGVFTYGGNAADYTSDSTIQADYAFFQSAFVGFLEAENVHIVASGSIYGGDRYDKNGTIIDGTKPGFFISASGACKGAGIEFEGSQGGGVQWGGGVLVGSELNIVTCGHPALASMNGTDVAFVDSEGDELRMYRWNGYTFVYLAGSAVSIAGAQEPALAAMNATDVAYIDDRGDLGMYRWNGTVWAYVAGSNLNTSISGGRPRIATMNATDIAFIDSYNDDLRMYRWNGTVWAYVAGSELNIPDCVTPAITAMNGTDIAFIDSGNDDLRMYRWNGTVWAYVAGSELNIPGCSIPAIAALNGTDIAFIDSNTDELRMYRWNGTVWAYVATSGSPAIGGGWPALAAMNGTDVAFIDSTNDDLRLYRFAFALSKPWRYPFTS
jgi:hypothetical protein